MRLNRDTGLMLLLLAILVVILAFAAAGGGKTEALPLDSNSSAPEGAKALRLWLPELGYPVNTDLLSKFTPPSNAELVLMLEPLQILESEWEALDDWVKAGGTLIIAGDYNSLPIAASHYEFSSLYILNDVTPVTQAVPLHSSPALTDPVQAQAGILLTSERSDYVTHLATKDGAIAISFSLGRGRVVLCTSPYIFTNLGLKDQANAAFVLNLIALAEPHATVWFDEWHHGLRAASSETEIVGPGQWLRKTPIGNAFLFILAVVLLGLFLQGRAFGRPVPLPREIKRRSVLEHVTAVANLNRRAGHRADVLRQYHQQLKRHLGKRYRLDPSLSDVEYVAALKKFNPALDGEKLLKLLRGLTQTNINEADMVKLAAEAAGWIKE